MPSLGYLGGYLSFRHKTNIGAAQLYLERCSSLFLFQIFGDGYMISEKSITDLVSRNEQDVNG